MILPHNNIRHSTTHHTRTNHVSHSCQPAASITEHAAPKRTSYLPVGSRCYLPGLAAWEHHLRLLRGVMRRAPVPPCCSRIGISFAWKTVSVKQQTERPGLLGKLWASTLLVALHACKLGMALRAVGNIHAVGMYDQDFIALLHAGVT